MSKTPDTAPEPRYCDFYGMLSLKDFTARAAAGTLDSFVISERSVS